MILSLNVRRCVDFAVNCKEKEGESVNSARVIQVIETKSTRGKGTDADPVRHVTQYWDFEGNLICEKDSVIGTINVS